MVNIYAMNHSSILVINIEKYQLINTFMLKWIDKINILYQWLSCFREITIFQDGCATHSITFHHLILDRGHN